MPLFISLSLTEPIFSIPPQHLLQLPPTTKMSRTKRPPTYTGKKPINTLTKYESKSPLPQAQKAAQKREPTPPSPPSPTLKRKAEEEPEPSALTPKPVKRVKIAPVAKISSMNLTAKCSEEPHRKEEEARSRRVYKRGAKEYVPGRWASPEGYKKVNTSHFRTKEADWEDLVRRRNR